MSKLISIEGSDGTGKTTQSLALVNNFKKHKKLFKNKSISLKENDYMAAVLSFYFDQCYVENLFFND